MKKVVQGLLLSTLAVSAVQATIYGNRTYLAHRDELSYVGMEWTTKNHYLSKSSEKNLGATLIVTPFYSCSTNHADIGKLFGMGASGATATGKFTVTNGWESDVTGTVKSTWLTTLYGSQVDHAPNDISGVTNAAYGVLKLKPERSSWGAHLSWTQSLEKVLKGLSFCISAPIIEVQSKTLNATTALESSTPSNHEPTDGPNDKTILDYFTGNLSKAIATYSAVQQSKMAKGKLSTTYQDAVGVADVELRLTWDMWHRNKMSFGVGASLVLPTGNTPTLEYLFEPIYGNGGHVAAGLCGDFCFNAVNRKNLNVKFKVLVDWKYLFKSTEKRLLGLYDNTTAAIIPAGGYRLVMQDKHQGVFPGNNVMTLDTDVTPGNQFEGVVGFAGKWKQLTFDVGYDLFLREKNKVEFKETWSNDSYALVNAAYDMSLSVTHENRIGADADLGNSAAHVTTLLDMNSTPTSISIGLIQEEAKTSSSLARRVYDKTLKTDKDHATTKQSARLSVSTAPAITEAQVTHSILGGLSYKLTGKYPVILGVGGQVEFVPSNRNSSLEGWKVWGKFGINF